MQGLSVDLGLYLDNHTVIRNFSPLQALYRSRMWLTATAGWP